MDPTPHALHFVFATLMDTRWGHLTWGRYRKKVKVATLFCCHKRPERLWILLPPAKVHQPLVTDGGVGGDHLSEVGAQRSDRVERLVVNKGACQVDLGEKREVVKELDEEARLDRGAWGEVQAEKVVALLLIGIGNHKIIRLDKNDCRIELDINWPNIAKKDVQLYKI